MDRFSTFGQWVKYQRQALNLTQANLAQKAACSKSMINKIESGLRIPAKPLIDLLALHLKISPADYAHFVHLAQPQLMVSPNGLPDKAMAAPDNVRPSFTQAIPAPFTPLIGRKREVESVCSMLQEPYIRLLTLTGPGGTGKTRLALQVAAELKDKYADGVYFISLASVRDTALVLSTIVQALGLKSFRDQSDDELLMAFLHEKAALLILDNFEQALPAAKEIANLLTLTAYLKILVTSRALLRLTGEHEFPVPPLGVPDHNQTTDLANLALSPSVTLFVHHARAARAEFQLTAENASSVAEICTRLDGLPLAIELAAARCKVLTPQAILARLKGAMGGLLGFLSGGAQDLPARQQTIRQTIDWSYNLLNEREQIIFRRLGVFVGGCSLDAIEEVASNIKTTSKPRLKSATNFSGLDAAISLMGQSLLNRVEGQDGEPRFHLSETLREYALESLAKAGELEWMCGEQAAYFLRLVEVTASKLHGAEQETCLKQLDAEYNNIRSALTWSSTADVETALRFAGSLWEFWLTRGYLSEGRAWLKDILQRSENQSRIPAIVRAHALNGVGLLTSVQGNQEEASIYLKKSLRLFQEENDRLGEAWALNHLGQTLNLSSQREEALFMFENSLQIFRSLQADWHSAWVLINLGEVRLHSGETDRAFNYLSEARQLFSALGDKRGMAAAIDRLGRLAVMRRDSNQAMQLFSESMQLFTEIGDREGCGWANYHLGRMAYERGQMEEAVEYLIESLRLFEKMNDKWSTAWSLLRLGKVIQDMGLSENAARIFGTSDSILENFHERMSVSEREFIDKYLAEARAQSDAAAWARGQSLSSEKTLAWILEHPFNKK
jgi:predicted ATPase/transcriptional regulator with XRE-family HTH domain